MRYTVVSERSGGTTRIAFRGELDMSCCDVLERKLTQALDADGERIVLDLRELAFLDSTGLRVILKARTEAHQLGKQFELLRPGRHPRRVLELSGLD